MQPARSDVIESPEPSIQYGININADDDVVHDPQDNDDKYFPSKYYSWRLRIGELIFTGSTNHQ